MNCIWSDTELFSLIKESKGMITTRFALFIATTCTPNQFQCQNGNCLLNYQVCDGYNDCDNAEDEDDCSKYYFIIGFNVRQHVFMSDGSKSGRTFCLIDRIYHEYNINRNIDCVSFSPILHANIGITCGPNQFQCHNGSCIPSNLECNDYGDCNNAEDEINCSE